MRSFLKKFSLLGFLCLASMNFYAQTTITGTVVDSETGEPLPGATIAVQGTNVGVVTNVDGEFSISPPTRSATIVVSFVGYQPKTLPGAANVGTVELEPSTVGLDEVQVIASFAIERKTPVAVSTVRGPEIEKRIGNQEFTEVLRYTPSIYATKSGGGFGDGRINVRGFDQRNTAVMINGIPVNDMENGWVYWSNWAGLADVSSAVQVQRGLSASRLAISSVGGTINIITKSADMKQGGSAFASVGNDMYRKYGFSVNTGLMDNGWAVSVLASRTAGDGYVDGTQFSAYNYFASISKTLNDKHTIVLTGLGAPQWHHQRLWSGFDDVNLETFREENQGRRYNDLYGTLDGEEFSWRRNFYHKPKAFLNHYWDINDDTELNTSVYFSLGNGGGTGPRGRGRTVEDSSSIFDSSSAWRNADGTIRWDDIVEWQSSGNSHPQFGILYEDPVHGTYGQSRGPGLIRRGSMNLHTWTGILSTLNTDLTSNLNLNVGFDARYYKGEHYRRVENLLGLDSYLSTADINNPTNYINMADAADFGNFRNDSYKDGNNVINYWNDGLVSYIGLFSQLEYSNDILSAFLSLSGSNMGYKRIDYFNYLDSDPEQETDWYNMLGGTVKAGANYNINANNNLFAYGGVLSRQPNFDGVYINFVNQLNEDVKNENIYSFEAGYGFVSRYFNAKLNVYHTLWTDRVRTITEENEEDEEIFYTFNIGQLHQGVELELSSSPVRNLELRGMLSIGNWRYNQDFDAVGVNVDDPDDNTLYEATLALEDEKIGDAAQTTFSLGATYSIAKIVTLYADWIYYDNLYAQWSVTDNLEEGILELPEYNLLDLGLSVNAYTSDAFRVQVRGNVNNVLDEWYISEMYTNNVGDLYQNEGFIGFGRTWNATLKVIF